jgi:YebC/PmpR family DNA-binding regulatory protein
MSGHSKWANIKRDKAVNDSKRGNLFTKVSRLVTVAARQGGGDPDANPALRLAIDTAKDARMSKETIDRAIQRGTGVGAEGNFDELVYEGYGPGGEAFYIKAITDNRNRTVAELRNIFNKAGGSLGAAGSTAYIFTPDPESPTFMLEVEESKKENLSNLYDQLMDNDDVQQVYVNFTL